MSELLDIKMPQEPEPEAEVQEEVHIVEKEIQEVEQESREEQDTLPPPKEYIPDEEVFNPPQVKRVKKKCSEKQLAHLAKIRQKALAKKQENKKFLEEQKAKQERYRRTEQSAIKPKKKRVYVKPEPEEEIEYIYDDHPDHPDHRYEQPAPLPQVQQEPQFQGYQLTPAQIKQLQRDAIMDYEVIRKERKQHERIAQQQQYVEDERRKIMKQMGSPDNDPWSQCFN